jgi:hypothetical protein
MTHVASTLKLEAEGIIRNLGILELLGSYGEARIVGSVALDLIVKKDIDVHLVVRDTTPLEAAGSIIRGLLGRKHIKEIRVSDHRDKGGLKIGVDSYPGASGYWSIDIWVTDDVATTGFALVERLGRQLRLEHREAILRIKDHFHGRGQLHSGLSTLIYEAVIDGGIRTAEEFDSLLSEKEGGESGS